MSAPPTIQPGYPHFDPGCLQFYAFFMPQERKSIFQVMQVFSPFLRHYKRGSRLIYVIVCTILCANNGQCISRDRKIKGGEIWQSTPIGGANHTSMASFEWIGSCRLSCLNWFWTIDFCRMFNNTFVICIAVLYVLYVQLMLVTNVGHLRTVMQNKYSVTKLFICPYTQIMLMSS